MRQEQFIRFVQEVCYILKLSEPCSKTALNYFLQFKAYEGHKYDQQILMSTSIYLSVKIFQEQVRIRDILNTIYVITSLYKLSYAKMKQQKTQSQQINQQNSQNEDQEEPYIILKNLQDEQNLFQMIQPQYSLQNYNDYKGKIIEAQQILLRIIGFDFKLAEQNRKQLKRILITIHYLRCPSTLAKTIVKTYNDIHYINIKYWVQGIIYFGYLSIKIYTERFKDFQRRQCLSSKQVKQVQNLENFYKKVQQKDLSELFCADIKNLQKYTQKLIMFYDGIQINKKLQKNYSINLLSQKLKQQVQNQQIQLQEKLLTQKQIHIQPNQISEEQ